MYTIIANNGDYWETNCRTRKEAEQYMNLKFTQEEIESLELEILEDED